MRFPEKTVTLKDGRECILRPALPADAEEMIDYMRQTAGETPFLLRYPDEVRHTPESEGELLGRLLDDPHSLLMAGLVNGEIAGNCMLSGTDGKRKIRHRCRLAIALRKAYWHLGIGTAMIGYLTEIARQSGYEQMDLEVVAENCAAQALYAKCGFVESGRRHHALKFDDGSYHDEILMYKDLSQD
jgi:RimJ/RimL family protein N-acetyltransferase